MREEIKKIFFIVWILTFATSAWASKEYKPFVLAYKTTGELFAVAEDVKRKLENGGFQVLGSYSPYEGTIIIGITDENIIKTVAGTDKGGFGAAQRVSVVSMNNEIQVSYTNPVYMAFAYRLNHDQHETADKLKNILGATQEFGPKEGVSSEDLKEYSYTIMHPEFDEPIEIAKYNSFDEAVSKVEEGLKKGKFGVNKIYRVDLNGKQETLFAVALGNDEKGRKDGSDLNIMKEVDFKPLKSAAHLPYEILVSGNKVYSLPAEFRIAISFPDLSMMGDNSFMNIMDCPEVIAEMLAHTAGNMGYKH